MQMELTTNEARALGVFIEKELATPDYYPLSLNAMTNACNQKTNRHPIMQLDENEVEQAIESLRQKGLAMQSQDAGSRVKKFRHTLRERLYLEDPELAILAELLLRGAQTPGELRSRSDRMTPLAELSMVEKILQELINRDEPLVAQLDRQPGRKEHRYRHLFCGPVSDQEHRDQTETSIHQDDSSPDLQEEVAQLKMELMALRQEFDKFRKQFE